MFSSTIFKELLSVDEYWHGQVEILLVWILPEGYSLHAFKELGG
jgi:hypothetical protein